MKIIKILFFAVVFSLLFWFGSTLNIVGSIGTTNKIYDEIVYIEKFTVVFFFNSTFHYPLIIFNNHPNYYSMELLNCTFHGSVIFYNITSHRNWIKIAKSKFLNIYENASISFDNTTIINTNLLIENNTINYNNNNIEFLDNNITNTNITIANNNIDGINIDFMGNSNKILIEKNNISNTQNGINITIKNNNNNITITQNNFKSYLPVITNIHGSDNNVFFNNNVMNYSNNYVEKYGNENLFIFCNINNTIDDCAQNKITESSTKSLSKNTKTLSQSQSKTISKTILKTNTQNNINTYTNTHTDSKSKSNKIYTETNIKYNSKSQTYTNTNTNTETPTDTNTETNTNTNIESNTNTLQNDTIVNNNDNKKIITDGNEKLLESVVSQKVAKVILPASKSAMSLSAISHPYVMSQTSRYDTIITMLYCNIDIEEYKELSYYDYQMQMTVGNGEFKLLIGSMMFAIVVTFMLFSTVIMIYLFKLKINKMLQKALGLLSSLTISYYSPILVRDTIVIYIYSTNRNEKVLATICFALVLIITCNITYIILCSFKCVLNTIYENGDNNFTETELNYNYRDKKQEFVNSVENDFCEYFEYYFGATRSISKKFVVGYNIVDLWITLLISIVEGTRPESGNCIGQTYAIIIFSSLYFLYQIIFKPFFWKVEQYSQYFKSSLQLIMSVLVQLSIKDDRYKIYVAWISLFMSFYFFVELIGGFFLEYYSYKQDKKWESITNYVEMEVPMIYGEKVENPL